MSSNVKKSRKAGTSKEKEEEYEPGSWECTVCTYRNNYEAFKCEICDTRKGTSTRKPRLNPSVVQQQTLVQNLAVQQSLGERGLKKQRNSDSRSRYSPESNFSVATSSRVNVINSAALDRDSPSSMRIDSRLLKRKMVGFRDALVVRSSVKKRVVNVNGLAFTVTEFKPRTSQRGRKKLHANSIPDN